MTTSAARARLHCFETSTWSSTLTDPVHSKEISIPLTPQHIDKATWSQYHNPVSIAIKEHLDDHCCASLIWNSDGFMPRHQGDDARIGIHQEVQNPQTGDYNHEVDYYLPLPARAARAMWNLRSEGLDSFQPITMRLRLPLAVISQPRQPAAAA